jgi:hypothetical protein
MIIPVLVVLNAAIVGGVASLIRFKLKEEAR